MCRAERRDGSPARLLQCARRVRGTALRSGHCCGLGSIAQHLGRRGAQEPEVERPDPVELADELLLEADPPDVPEFFAASETAEPELAEPPLDAPEEEPPFLPASARESLW